MISYAYQGGEPTLRGLDFFRKAVAYQKQYNKNQIQVHNALQTNGYVIDEEWCRFFKENHFLLYPDFLWMEHKRFHAFGDRKMVNLRMIGYWKSANLWMSMGWIIVY